MNLRPFLFLFIGICFPYFFTTDVYCLEFKEFSKLFKLIQEKGSNKHIPGINEKEFREVMKNKPMVTTGNAEGENKFAFVAKRADVPLWKLWAVIIDREHYRIFNKEIKESRILSKTNDYFLTYIFLEAPFPMKNRHQVIDCFANQKLYDASKKRIGEHYFKINEHQSEHIKQALESGVIKLSKDKVMRADEIKKNNGQWILIAIDTSSTLVIVYSVNNPGGSIPKFLVNAVAPGKLEDAVNAMIQYARDEFDKHFTKDHEELLGPTRLYTKPSDLKEIFY
jgi:hypothetical protein